MRKSNRQDQILKLLRENKTVKVSELSELFNISELTIRKDLNELYSKGKLHRVHGGATPIDTFEVPFLERKKKNSIQKELIGHCASKLIHEGDSVFIDNGTTTEYLTDCLHDFTRLSVITTGMNIIYALHREENITVYVPEGRIDDRAFAIVGTQAEASLKRYLARICFMSCDGLTLEQGVLQNSYESAATSKIMRENSQLRVLLCDSSKFGQIGAICLCPLSDIDMIITDAGIPQEYKTSIEAAGVKIIIAK